MPERIRFTTYTLRYNECAWVRINDDAHSYGPTPGLEGANAALQTLSVDLAMTAAMV